MRGKVSAGKMFTFKQFISHSVRYRPAPYPCIWLELAQQSQNWGQPCWSRLKHLRAKTQLLQNAGKWRIKQRPIAKVLAVYLDNTFKPENLTVPWKGRTHKENWRAMWSLWSMWGRKGWKYHQLGFTWKVFSEANLSLYIYKIYHLKNKNK